ncbi:DNA polymerase III subunit chi [Aristophania vespae]
MAAGQELSSTQMVEEGNDKNRFKPQIGFYHLTRTSVQEALLPLLDRTLSSDERALICCSDTEELERLDRALWESPVYFWLPHGSQKTGFAARQPIWLSAKAEPPPNGALFLFRIDGADIIDVNRFKRVFDLFDGQNEDSVVRARLRWKKLKQDGFDLTYWKQEPQGWRQAG